jgi:hypothetical protein
MSRDDLVSLRALASQCRSLARGCSTRDVATSLKEMADTYDERADRAEGGALARAPWPRRGS